MTAANVAGYAWLSIAGSGLAYTVWFRGIGRLPVSALTFLGLLSPLVATLLGWTLLDQDLTTLQLVGVVAVIAAVVLPQLHSSGALDLRQTTHERTATVHDASAACSPPGAPHRRAA